MEEQLSSLNDYVEEAISFIKENLPDEEIFVGFSGGKDSVTIAELVKMSGIPYKLVYTNTTIDPPEILKLIKKSYPETLWVRPKESFWKMIPKRNPPLLYARWCCTTLKKQPSWKLLHKHRILGIRAEESKARFRYPRINLYKYKKYKQEHTQYYPILDWPEWAVWEFIKENNLPICSLYDEGFDRLGCVVCPMRLKKGTTKYIDPWRKRFPGYFKAFESACKKWYYKRKEQGRDMMHDSPEEFVQAWYRGEASWYGKKRKDD